MREQPEPQRRGAAPDPSAGARRPASLAAAAPMMLAFIEVGALIFLYLLAVNSLLAGWEGGPDIAPVEEALLAALVYFLLGPFFAWIAMIYGILLNPTRLVIFICMMFLPIMLLDMALLYAVGFEHLVYFDYQDQAVAVAETFAVKILKAIPMVLLAPYLFVLLARRNARRAER